MKPKITPFEFITFSIIFIFISTFGFSQGIFENEITGPNPNTYNPYIENQVLDLNITSASIGRGIGIVGKNKNNEYKASSWSTATFDENDYFEFTITPETGYQIDFINFIYTPKKNNGSVDSFELRSSIDGYSSTIDNPAYIPSGVSINLSSAVFQGIEGVIIFRLYAWGADNDNKSFSIKDFEFNGYVNLHTLALGDHDFINKSLSIIEHKDGDIQLKLNDGLEMKSVQIIDLQGKVLYDLNVSGESIALDLNISSRTVYMARVQLTNGQIAIKKAVKRY